MGNTSSSSKDGAAPSASISPQTDVKDRDTQTTQAPRRRESIQVLPHTRPSAAPPSASLESAQGLPPSRASTRTDQSHSQPRSTSSNHARKRSQTSATPASRLQDAVYSEEKDRAAGSSRHSPEQQNLRALRSVSPSQPMKVTSQPQLPRDPNLEPATLEPYKVNGSLTGYIAPSSHYARPPRLPLPIGREEFLPGSPIISPADLAGSVGQNEDPEIIRRKTSELSTTTADDEELGEEFRVDGPSGPTADTIIEWKQPGERVYVTGSFSGWNRKHKLHKKYVITVSC